MRVHKICPRKLVETLVMYLYSCTCVHSSLCQEREESKFIIRAITYEKNSVKNGITGLLNKVSFATFSCNTAGGSGGQSM